MQSSTSQEPNPSVARTVLIGFVLIATCLRFFLIDRVPPGFYIDEAAISAQVICLRQSWHSLFGQSLSLFTPVLGGGYLTISYLLPSVIWTSLFGDSVASFRMMTAFFSALFIGGSYLLGFRFWRSREAGWLCALSAAVSPWAFQFARIAWDPSLAPAYLVWAMALTWPRKNQKLFEGFIGAVLFAAAAYCYPPIRVQLVFVLPLIAVARYRREIAGRKVLASVGLLAAVGILVLPLVLKTISGEIQGRFEALSIFNADYLTATYGDAGFIYSLDAFFKNMLSFFSPSYLLIHGDQNLRHSTGWMGEWSWLDAAGVLIAIVAGALVLSKKKNGRPKYFEITFVVAGYLGGLVPAALTWESNPHALRSIGSLVFLCLGVGGSLSLFWRDSRRWQSAILGIALASFFVFVNVYFFRYPSVAGPWFDQPVIEAFERLRSENRASELRPELNRLGIHYDPMALSYYELSSGQRRCEF